MLSASELLKQKLESVGKSQRAYITQEFQDYAYRLAVRFGDVKKVAVIMNYAKKVPRAILDDAASFASDYPKAKNKYNIFMWKMGQLLVEYRQKHPEFSLKRNTKSKKKNPKSKIINKTSKVNKKINEKLNIEQMNLFKI